MQICSYTSASCTVLIQNCWIIKRTAGWPKSFFSPLLFIVTCLPWIESSLSLCLFLFGWHSWWGKSRIPNKVQSITYAGRYFGQFTATVRAVYPRQEFASITSVPKQQKTEMKNVANIEMCVTSSILSLTSSLCFKCGSKPCTQMNDPAKEFLHASQCSGLCRANLICGFAQTIMEFEQICYCPGAEWWRRATQRRMGPLWNSENVQAARRMQ